MSVQVDSKKNKSNKTGKMTINYANKGKPNNKIKNNDKKTTLHQRN